MDQVAPPTNSFGALDGPKLPPGATVKPSKWRSVFVVVGILQILGVASFFAILAIARQQAGAGVSGTEFVALAVFMTIVPGISLLALINVVGLPIYLKKYRPQGRYFKFAIASIVLSLVILCFGMVSIYRSFIGAPSHTNKLSEELSKTLVEDRRRFAEDNAKPEITKDEAIALLKDCSLKGFYYTNQTDKSDPANGGWGELSATGVVLTKINGLPYRISIADRLVDELVPIAREAQKTCGGNPQFWHDGKFEQLKGDSWYFGDEVTNTIGAPAKTKTDVINMMESYKVDFLFGQTSAAKNTDPALDANTQVWLQQAEKSSTGVEILETNTISYVFLSKKVTPELLETARKYRTSCNTADKIHITVDGWAEAELSDGTYKKVRFEDVVPQ